MRRITVGAARTLAAALACAACLPAAGPAFATTRPDGARSAPPASTAACYAFAVGALRRHVVVRRTPSACAGLGAAQINQAVDRAIRTVAGPLPKAAARRQDLADSRYLASLIRQGRPPRAASLAPTTSASAGTLEVRLAALAVWLATALAGAYLLAARLRRGGRRRVRALGLAGGHAGLAITGLCLWVAFVVTAAPALGWLDVAISWIIVGLGMATLLSEAAPQPAAAPVGLAARPGAAVAYAPVRAPVITIALHGVLAAATIVLVLLAVVSAG